jgi:hypothetical protein
MIVNRIKHGVDIGTTVPMHQQYGNVGRWVQDELEKNGHVINHGKGCDLLDYGIEVKSRKRNSNSPHNVGSMTVGNIMETIYKSSSVSDKIQRQYRVEYDNDESIVQESGVYDFTDPFIQEKIGNAYHQGKLRIIQNEQEGIRPTYVRGSEWGNFELNEGKTSYTFRIPNGAMKKIKSLSKNSKTFNALFDVID